ncbi:hypothetical protein SKAU_G00312430 [Synaphobranchus kaupii]|uniref:VPS9 domain-containing protein n=1 Tax=Synaphobranchus kaupii TaxID=118154 RepID=A0A9Q1IJ99_SYNKA|nr:hypothetical protein SKAU_G00312430 [Synaphobranchus kaupii]
MACAAPEGGLKPLQNAMKLANVAIQLEAGNRHKEAYCEYLRSINYISHAMLEDAVSRPDGETRTVEVERMLRLAEQCLERVKSFIARRGDLPTPTPNPTSAATPNCSTVKNEVILVASEPAPRQPPRPTHRRVLSEGGGEPSPFLPPEIFQKLQEVESQDTKKELTPIEEASRLNQKLKANYEARLARLHPGQATQKTSLTLSLQRQMMENLIIAKARQDALHRKMEERRLRLQEEANRRFAGSGMITAEEQEQRVLYANVLEYEQDNDWPKVWKANLKKNPNDSTLVSGLISYLLSCSEHPVMKLLKRLQYRVYNRLYPIVSKGPAPSPTQPMKMSRSVQNLRSEQLQAPPSLNHSLSDASLSISHDFNANEENSAHAGTTLPTPDRENSFEDLEQYLSQLDWSSAPDSAPDLPEPVVETYITHLEECALKDHLRAIIKDIHNAIDRLLSLCLLSFECLNTADSKDQCVACIEEAFFCPLWCPLLALFRQVYRERELSFGASMRLYRNATPGDVGVAPKLFPEDPALLQGSYPYESAVQELQHLCREFCPQRKLECIVRTLRLICVCAEDYRNLQDPDTPASTAAIGADDLLPILSFVALRTELPQLVSECAALEEFIHEGWVSDRRGGILSHLHAERIVLCGVFTHRKSSTSQPPIYLIQVSSLPQVQARDAEWCEGVGRGLFQSADLRCPSLRLRTHRHAPYQSPAR